MHSCESVFCMWQRRHRGASLWEITCWVTAEEANSLLLISEMNYLRACLCPALVRYLSLHQPG